MTSSILHVYHPSRNLNLLEHTPYGPTSSAPPSSYASQPPDHILLFVGGMFDTFNHPHYVSDLAHLFPISSTSHQPWRVMHVQLSSAGRAWGIFSIDRDIEEIATAITFIRTKLYTHKYIDIVLMGHSTGCQDIMRYLTALNPLNPRNAARPSVEGAILQAPVSDRDAVLHTIDDEDAPETRKAYDAAMKIVKSTAEKDRRNVILPMNLTKPLFAPAPINIERFLSLVSPDSPQNPSVEDFFSHDLGDHIFQRTFGSIGENGVLQLSSQSGRTEGSKSNEQSPIPTLLVLMSDSDENVRPHIVSQKDSLNQWGKALTHESGCSLDPASDVILNAIHDVGGDDWPSQEARLVNLRAAVLSYLSSRVGDIGSEAWDIWRRDREKVMRLKRDDGRDVNAQVGVLKL